MIIINAYIYRVYFNFFFGVDDADNLKELRSTSIESEEKTTDLWRKTVCQRRHMLIKEQVSVYDFINQFPCLQAPWGYKLVNIDKNMELIFLLIGFYLSDITLFCFFFKFIYSFY